MFDDANFWVLISFCCFVVLATVFGRKAVAGLIDARIQSVKDEIQAAEALRVEAQELLAEYERKQRDSMNEAARIVDGARRQAADLKKAAIADMDDLFKRREEQLQFRVKSMQDKALQDIKSHAAKLTIGVAERVLEDSFDKDDNQKQVNSLVEKLPKLAS